MRLRFVTRIPGRVCVTVLAAAAVAAAVAVPLAVSASHASPALPAQDQRWRRDIGYLTSELPEVRVDGLGPVTRTAWQAAADRLEAAVPRLTYGQLVVGLARMVAMLHDDETQLDFPPGPVYPLDAQWFGGHLYLLGVPAAHRDLLGAQLLAVDGHPVAQVMTRIGSVIDYQDPGILRATQAGYLDDGHVLYWLGITSSPTSAEFTVRADTGSVLTARLTAGGSAAVDMASPVLSTLLPGLVHIPLPLYLLNSGSPYWMRILAAQHAVYLKYNQCVDTAGFQRLAGQALAILRRNPGYRLIIDLRDNLGGDSAPFQPLISGIRADPAINRPGRIFGLVDQFTDSSATVDTYNLSQETHALVIGVPPADPIDGFGDENTFTLPQSGIVVQYTTSVVNRGGGKMGLPGITVSPTVQQVLAGQDPVLAKALSYKPPAASGDVPG
jgi:hypothetical protein